jgi:hypothetical protein
MLRAYLTLGVVLLVLLEWGTEKRKGRALTFWLRCTRYTWGLNSGRELGGYSSGSVEMIR